MRLYSKISISTLFGLLFVSLLFAAIPAGYTGTPFSYDTLRGHPQQIPGVIKAVFWDNGGEGVAFHESSNNTDQQGSGSMRKDFTGKQIQADWPVDMQYFELCRDHEEDGRQSDTGSWFLGWTFPPEWQKHTVHVNTAGTYYVTFHMAESDSPNIIGLTFNNGKTDSVKNLRKSIIPSDCCGGKISLGETLLKVAAKSQERPAVYYGGREITYGELDELADRFGAALQDLGVRKGDRVAIYLPNLPQFVFAYYGALRVGAIVVTASPLYKERELAHILTDSGAKVLLCLDKLYPYVESVREKAPLSHVYTTECD